TNDFSFRKDNGPRVAPATLPPRVEPAGCSQECWLAARVREGEAPPEPKRMHAPRPGSAGASPSHAKRCGHTQPARWCGAILRSSPLAHNFCTDCALSRVTQ